MEGFVRTFRRPVNVPEDRDGYWLSKTPAERIEAVGMINLTIKGEKHAEQKLSSVCQVTRRQGR
jgi:hypothetical protein